ncbi:hypothetical protein AALP_AA5G220500 [Arabis alpina]|uniref:Protein kinase domain-containing protein n=1 Tax=Arabis alpina TaxID=50452 RepID=A0A087GYP3_ARAAL|nr:hypothetical protein AALP_AA5G220500 [Arabis alpina]
MDWEEKQNIARSSLSLSLSQRYLQKLQSERHWEMEFWRRRKARKLFLKNGSKFLEELIADCNGVSNPIRFFSSDQILKATISSYRFWNGHFMWYNCVIEDRAYVIRQLTDIFGGGERVRSVIEDSLIKNLADLLEWGTSVAIEDRFNFSKELADSQVYNDIVLSARVSNHSGFLKLIGCCLEFRFPFLVFENPENGVLNKRGSVGLDDSPLLPWNVRLKIAKQVAIAVTYLHTAFPRIIIHRDIKPTNVFLDKNWNAKLTDFLIAVTLPEGKSWIEDDVMGTLGYIDPTYVTTGLVTEYTDVFSFGILMLILLMGRPAVSRPKGVDDTILDYVKGLKERGQPIEFGDDRKDMRPGQMKMFLGLALRCCAERNEDRPKMILVAKELKLIERSLDSNVLKTGLATEEMDDEEEPLAIESLGDLLTSSSLNSRSNRSNPGFRILLFCTFFFLLHFWETIYIL